MGASVTVSYMVLLIGFLLSAASFNFIILCSGADQGVGSKPCSSKERQALLDLKQGLTDPSNWLSSWSLDLNGDCCQWIGVQCHNFTGAVTELHLENYDAINNIHAGHTLGGHISPSLLQLESLHHLDLSYNGFQHAPIPRFLGSMKSLRYLDLSRASFWGIVPRQLQNLSSIRHLDLGGNSYGIRVDSLGWIAHLRTLEYLDMSDVDLHSIEPDWLQVVSNLPSLSELYFSGCELENMIPPPIGHVNFPSLQVLDLSYNRLSCRIPNWLFNLSSTLQGLNFQGNSIYGEIPEKVTSLRMLKYLLLDYNSLTGLIPSGIGQLNHLEYLYLESNKLNGSIPWSIGNLTSLEFLDLSSNQLGGTLPESTGHLSNLEELYISSNPMLSGIVSEVKLAKLSKLKVLSLFKTSLSLSVSPRWTPPFQLQSLGMSSVKIGPAFPSWLQSQTSLSYLDISMSGISDTVPDWFWELASGVETIKISGNKIEGDLTHVLFNSTSVDISSNCFRGQLMQLSTYVKALNVKNNSVSGLISTFICDERNINNQLEFLDISINYLSGELSDCWMHWRSLRHLNLGSNNLSGKIPISIGFLYQLEALQLSRNRLFGGIPLSLKNCTSLGFIDLGENELTGSIPGWIGETGYKLVLGLRSNQFSGNIPVQLCQLSDIMVLDLSNNDLSGTIPKCLSNFSSMVYDSKHPQDPSIGYLSLEYGYDVNLFQEPLELFAKGTQSIYKNILKFVRLIDFSNNMLSGTIPTDISRLTGLRFLNLSHNHLVGEIPKKLGSMTNLESLDLSRNQLSGEIPESMSKMSFLNYLDLSYNNLSGNIPLSTQLQSLNESSFLGNVKLCGAPLEEHCNREEGPHQASQEYAQESHGEMFWFYVGVGPGFTCAFCGVCATMYFNTAWRHALFQFIEDVLRHIYVFAFVMVNRIKRRLKRLDVSVG